MLKYQHGLVLGSLRRIQSPVLRQSWSKRSWLSQGCWKVQRSGCIPGQVSPTNPPLNNQILLLGSLEPSSVELLMIASSRRVFSSCCTSLVALVWKQWPKLFNRNPGRKESYCKRADKQDALVVGDSEQWDGRRKRVFRGAGGEILDFEGKIPEAAGSPVSMTSESSFGNHWSVPLDVLHPFLLLSFEDQDARFKTKIWYTSLQILEDYRKTCWAKHWDQFSSIMQNPNQRGSKVE